MPTSVLKPGAIEPNRIKRQDVGRGNRQWTFINRSSYYVVVRMDFSEGELDSNPELVVEPYSTQRVNFPERKDRICWKADGSFPRAANPTNAPEVFGFVASDLMMQAYPASILNVGLTDAPSTNIQASAATLANLENVDNPAGSTVIRMRTRGKTQDQIRVVNDGDIYIGNGDTPATKFIEAAATHRQLLNSDNGGIIVTSRTNTVLGQNAYYDAATQQWMRYNTAAGGSILLVQAGTALYQTFPAGANPITFNPAKQVAMLEDIPAAPPPELETPAQSKQIRSPGAASGYAMLAGQVGSHICHNAFWDGTNWMRFDTAAGGAITATTKTGLIILPFAAGANPIVFGPQETVATSAVPSLIPGPTLQTGWTAGNYGYRKLANGLVTVRGFVTSPTTGWTAGTVVFVMPAGFRPFSTCMWIASTNAGGSVAIRMENTGNLSMQNAGNAQTTFLLNAIIYVAEA